MQSFVQLNFFIRTSNRENFIFFSCFSSSFMSQADVLLGEKKNDLFLHNRTSREEGAKAYGTRRYDKSDASTTSTMSKNHKLCIFFALIFLLLFVHWCSLSLQLSKCQKSEPMAMGLVFIGASRFFRRRQRLCVFAYEVKINE